MLLLFLNFTITQYFLFWYIYSFLRCIISTICEISTVHINRILKISGVVIITYIIANLISSRDRSLIVILVGQVLYLDVCYDLFLCFSRLTLKFFSVYCNFIFIIIIFIIDSYSINIVVVVVVKWMHSVLLAKPSVVSVFVVKNLLEQVKAILILMLLVPYGSYKINRWIYF